MATGNRTLKLSILADVDDLKKKLGEADKAVEDNSNKIADFGKKAAAAFAVAVGTLGRRQRQGSPRRRHTGAVAVAAKLKIKLQLMEIALVLAHSTISRFLLRSR